MEKVDSILKSNLDESVNFITKKEIGYLEARYVRRTPHYFVAYLSSQTGCNRGCNFCHLTATNQTKYLNANREDYKNQAIQVLDYYKDQPRAEEINFNFMSRGEALANPELLENNYNIFKDLSELSIANDLVPKFNVSTIFPKNLKDKELYKIFKGFNPSIYYSLYSLKDSFRSKWMPGALDVNLAIKKLKNYQEVTNKIVTIHFAFIKGENDSKEDMIEIIELLNKNKLLCNFNIVRYNPFSPKQGEESSEETILENHRILSSGLPGRVNIIKRVGFDVKASCGMFIK